MPPVRLFLFTPERKKRAGRNLPLSFLIGQSLTSYAAFFFAAFHFAHRALCAAAIFLRADLLIVRTGLEAPASFVFAQRAFCASEIRRRADAESIRLDVFTLSPPPV